jgi:signal transduction histidine kinase/ActR/RegA family two-component response regulator
VRATNNTPAIHLHQEPGHQPRDRRADQDRPPDPKGIAMSLTGLVQHLRASREEIVHRWLETVLTTAHKAPAARGLAQVHLRNHIPALLEQIETTVADEATPGVETEARVHGSQRWEHGFLVDELIGELSALRLVVLNQIEKYVETEDGLSALEGVRVSKRVADVIDRTARASASQFVMDALTQRQAVEGKLEAANQELQTVGEQKDRFLAMLSHELRNPLAPILSAVEVLKRNGPAEPRLERAREIIERQALHQARLLDDLLDIHRVTQGKITLRPEIIDLKAAVAQAIESSLPNAEAKGLALEVEQPDPPLPVEVDPVRTVQIVTNLLNNAIRYTSPPGRITLTLRREDGQATVRVRGTGIGIAAVMLPRVFDLFAQADTSLDRPQGGLGVGLALAKRLVALQGGSIQAHSDGLGKGSEFIVRLPLAQSVAPPPQPMAAPVEPRVGRHVLLVEDNADALEALALLLTDLGHQPLKAGDGPAALRLAVEEKPDAYLIDIGLPGMDGYELARRLRQMPVAEHALLIALTGYGSPEYKERAREAGFDAHLTKPADVEQLRRLLIPPEAPAADKGK